MFLQADLDIDTFEVTGATTAKDFVVNGTAVPLTSVTVIMHYCNRTTAINQTVRQYYILHSWLLAWPVLFCSALLCVFCRWFLFLARAPHMRRKVFIDPAYILFVLRS